MTFASPAWLLLLLPWGGLVVLALRAYRPKVLVPFLRLWPKEETAPSKRRGWRPPPVSLILILLAALLSILALAGASLGTGQRRLGSCTILVDRGVTMLAGNRFARAAQAALDALKPMLTPDAQIHVVDHTSERHLLGPAQLTIDALGKPTAADVHEALSARLGNLGEDLPWPVVLISDLPDSGRDVIAVRPTGPVNNVGIASAEANAGICRLRIRNDSDRTSVTIAISDGMPTEAQLGGRGSEVTVELPMAQPFARVALEIEDDLPDDNVRWLGDLPPAVVSGEGLPAVVARFAKVYSESRRPAADSPKVTLTAKPTDVERCVMVPAEADGELTSVRWPAELPDHVILQQVRLPQRMVVGRTALPAGQWNVLLTHDDKPLLAADDQARRVWVGFLPEANDEAVAEYLVLLTNAVRFCGGGAFEQSIPRVLSGEWERIEPKEQPEVPGMRAGLYERGDERRAIYVAAPVLTEFGADANAGVQKRLAAYADAKAQKNATPWLITTALLLVIGAIACARR